MANIGRHLRPALSHSFWLGASKKVGGFLLLSLALELCGNVSNSSHQQLSLLMNHGLVVRRQWEVLEVYMAPMLSKKAAGRRGETREDGVGLGLCVQGAMDDMLEPAC